MNVFKVDVNAGETLIIPPGYFPAACCVHEEVVTGTKLCFLPIGQSHFKLFSALAEMNSDAPAVEKILKATVDAMALST